jgi:prepilin-type N-terminal cleavage/methylation domain-containing protein
VAYRVKRCEGFSLLELVIVIVIMGIIAAVAIPRMSRGSSGASDGALIGNLAVLRNAIEMCAGEHTGTYPSEAAIEDQLTQYTDIYGATSATKTATHAFGPYLRKSPELPVGDRKGNARIAKNNGPDVGWKYNKKNRKIEANTKPNEKDDSGKKYKDY